MKTKNIIALLVFFIYGCKKDDTPTLVNVQIGYGKIDLLDEVGNFQNNMSQIKVTILENQQTSYTDSLGVFSFTNLSNYGPYTFLCEYNNYPPITLQNYILSSTRESALNHHMSYYDASISPIAQYKQTIKIDTSIYPSQYTFLISSVSSKPSYSMFYLLLFHKQAQIDYATHTYVSFVGCGNSTSVEKDTVHSSFEVWSTDKLTKYGFNKGDSLYVRVFPVSSFYFYIDSSTKFRMYPSIGDGSNVVGIKVR